MCNDLFVPLYNKDRVVLNKLPRYYIDKSNLKECDFRIFWRNPNAEALEKYLYSDRYDAIELSTLKYVLDVCKSCSSAAEAGRKIYNVTRGNRATPNDSDRIAKYLKTYSLKFSDLRHA